MTLSEAFSRCEHLPRLSFTGTSPVHKLQVLSEQEGVSLWVKRDDQLPGLYAGNKARKLEYLLGDARSRGCDTLITAGAWGSHHVLATSIYGNAHGFEVEAAMMPQPLNEHVAENLRLTLGEGTIVHRAYGYLSVPPVMAKAAAQAELRGKRAYTFGPGGSTPEGAVGFVEAGFELARQIQAGELPEPDAIVMAFGTGGTAAGLAIGLCASGVSSDIIGVRVTDKLYFNRATLRLLTHRIVRHLRRYDRRFPNCAEAAMRRITIDQSQHDPGYGVPNPESSAAEELAQLDAMTCDPTYTAKALATALRRARQTPSAPILFWNTLSATDLAPRLAEAPSLPRWAS